MPVFAVNGIDLHAEITGDGPPLVLVAGLASDSASWTPVVPRLSRTRRLVMPDNRGSGRTAARPSTLGDYAGDVIALLDALEIERADFLGHSMGGAIAIEIAATHPERVGRLVLAAAAPATPPRARMVIDALVELREAGAPEESWFRMFFTWLFRPDAFARPRDIDVAVAMAMRYPFKQSAEAMRAQVEAMRGRDLTPALSRIRAEARVLAGAHDLLFPLADLRAAYAGRQGFRLDILEEAAHSLHWDAPDAFCRAVEAFLAGPAPDRPTGESGL